ncbi:hypothetical protein BJ741DRAFT_593368 [Chytriomyces cf. hyalinus JEL632]|nr:hypothetical protein BJ741DRAFT_593368 [Chytriomyces cf. hyalinus JEL632]
MVLLAFPADTHAMFRDAAIDMRIELQNRRSNFALESSPTPIPNAASSLNPPTQSLIEACPFSEYKLAFFVVNRNTVYGGRNSRKPGSIRINAEVHIDGKLAFSRYIASYGASKEGAMLDGAGRERPFMFEPTRVVETGGITDVHQASKVGTIRVDIYLVELGDLSTSENPSTSASLGPTEINERSKKAATTTTATTVGRPREFKGQTIKSTRLTSRPILSHTFIYKESSVLEAEGLYHMLQRFPPASFAPHRGGLNAITRGFTLTPPDFNTPTSPCGTSISTTSSSSNASIRDDTTKWKPAFSQSNGAAKQMKSFISAPFKRRLTDMIINSDGVGSVVEITEKQQQPCGSSNDVAMEIIDLVSSDSEAEDTLEEGECLPEPKRRSNELNMVPPAHTAQSFSNPPFPYAEPQTKPREPDQHTPLENERASIPKRRTKSTDRNNIQTKKAAISKQQRTTHNQTTEPQISILPPPPPPPKIIAPPISRLEQEIEASRLAAFTRMKQQTLHREPSPEPRTTTHTPKSIIHRTPTDSSSNRVFKTNPDSSPQTKQDDTMMELIVITDDEDDFLDRPPPPPPPRPPTLAHQEEGQILSASRNLLANHNHNKSTSFKIKLAKHAPAVVKNETSSNDHSNRPFSPKREVVGPVAPESTMKAKMPFPTPPQYPTPEKIHTANKRMPNATNFESDDVILVSDDENDADGIPPIVATALSSRDAPATKQEQPFHPTSTTTIQNVAPINPTANIVKKLTSTTKTASQDSRLITVMYRSKAGRIHTMARRIPITFDWTVYDFLSATDGMRCEEDDQWAVAWGPDLKRIDMHCRVFEMLKVGEEMEVVVWMERKS